MTGNADEEGGLLFRSVTGSDWPLIEALFGAKGACGGCWCMYWHAPPGAAAWEAAKGERNRAALKAGIENGVYKAVIAIAGDEAAGWCHFGPRQSFAKLERSRKIIMDDSAEWAVVCFFIGAKWRRRGVATGLLRAATEAALAAGARSVEGYPVLAKSREAPGPFIWTGVPSIFEKVGYRPVDADTGSRKVYRFHAH